MAEYLASIFGTEKDKYVTADHFYVCIIDRPDKDANLYNTLVNVFWISATYKNLHLPN